GCAGAAAWPGPAWLGGNGVRDVAGLPRLAPAVWLLAVFLLSSPSGAGEKPARPAERDAAARIDNAFRKALAGAALPAVADDATFLRRVTLDLTGRLPDPEDVRRFVADPASDKRARRVEALLQSDASAVHWGP